MTRKRRTAVVSLAALAVLVAGAPPASAIPPVGPGRSVTFTYYSSAAKTTVVGGYSYGYCGENFDYGTHTRWYTIRYVTCGS